MSVKVDQSILTQAMQNSTRVKTGHPTTTLKRRIDFDTVYGVAIIGMIWGGFFAAFLYM